MLARNRKTDEGMKSSRFDCVVMLFFAGRESTRQKLYDIKKRR